MADPIDRQWLMERLGIKDDCRECQYCLGFLCSQGSEFADACEAIFDAPSAPPEPRWIPCRERLPIKEFEDGRKNKTVYDIYPCLVTRYSTHTDEPRTRVYVCKSYFDGEDFLLHGGYAQNEENDTENTIAWMPLPEPYKEDSDDRPD